MASHDVKNVKDCAVVLANDLLSGLTVYLKEDGTWSEISTQAWRLNDDETATRAMALALESEQDNIIIGAYLADASTSGVPSHIRERIRVDGPSINYRQHQVQTLPATGTGA